MISYIDESNGSVTFILRRSDYIWRGGSPACHVGNDGDIVMGRLGLDHYGDITDAKIIIDEIREQLDRGKSVRRRRLQVEEMDRLNALILKWVRDDIEYIDDIDLFCDEILKALQLQPPEDTSNET